jgi:hypothetical protein
MHWYVVSIGSVARGPLLVLSHIQQISLDRHLAGIDAGDLVTPKHARKLRACCGCRQPSGHIPAGQVTNR